MSLLENQGVKRQEGMEGMEAAFERPAQIALIACVSVMGMAGIYFLALYLLTH